MLATVVAKQMCTPNCFVHRCMINSLVKKSREVLTCYISSLKSIGGVIFEL